jgi:hypothetical protein
LRGVFRKAKKWDEKHEVWRCIFPLTPALSLKGEGGVCARVYLHPRERE